MKQLIKKGIVSICLLSFCTNTWAQLQQCKLLEQASIAHCQNDYKLCLKALAQFQKDFPKHALIEEVNQQVAHIYFLQQKFTLAKAHLHAIIQGKQTGQKHDDYKARECKTTWKVADKDCSRIVSPEPYVHLQHQACMDLYSIFKKEKQLDSALHYLQLAERKYVYNYYCGNGNDMHDVRMALHYRDIYLAQKDTLSAIRTMTKEMFTYEGDYRALHSALKNLLHSIYTKDQLRKEVAKGINKIKKKEITINGRSHNRFKIDLFGQTFWLPMQMAYKITSIEAMQQKVRDEYFIKELMQ